MIQDLKHYSKSNVRTRIVCLLQCRHTTSIVRPLHCKVNTFICWKRMKLSIWVEVFHTVQYVSDKYQVWQQKILNWQPKQWFFLDVLESFYIKHVLRVFPSKNDVGVSCMELLWINWCWNQLLVQLRVFALIQQKTKLFAANINVTEIVLPPSGEYITEFWK